MGGFSLVVKLGEVHCRFRLLFSWGIGRMVVDIVLVFCRLELVLGRAPEAIGPGGAVMLSYSWLDWYMLQIHGVEVNQKES